MSLGPVNNQFSQATQQPKAVDATKKAETQPTNEADQPTNKLEEAAGGSKAAPEAQDAARRANQAQENQIRQQLEQPTNGEWLEARGRKRGGRGGRTMAQAPTRGLGTNSTELA